jgi:hypothetical protein
MPLGGDAVGGLALYVLHGSDQRPRAAAKAHAPAGHGVALGNAVHREHPVAQGGLHLGDRAEGEAVVEEVLVHVVREDPDVRMPEHHGG